MHGNKCFGFFIYIYIFLIYYYSFKNAAILDICILKKLTFSTLRFCKLLWIDLNELKVSSPCIVSIWRMSSWLNGGWISLGILPQSDAPVILYIIICRMKTGPHLLCFTGTMTLKRSASIKRSDWTWAWHV